jgi:anaerobic selenocysteine-containing dehydrogenase
MPWGKTVCVLCDNRCELEVQVENNRIVKVRGDKDSPISEGYICTDSFPAGWKRFDVR